MKIMRYEGECYTVLTNLEPLKPLNERPLMAQVLAYESRIRALQHTLLVFSLCEQQKVIQLLRQVHVAIPPPGVSADHATSLIRTVLDRLLYPHGLISELVPPNGGQVLPPAECVLAITKLHRS